MNTVPPKIFLAGMMGTGKSTVGQALAKALNCEFLDTDTLIEARVGQRINEIFLNQGEKAFRRFEKEVIQKICSEKQKCLVVALGGGALTHGSNLARLQKAGMLLCLTASPKTLAKRLQKNQDRPLLRNLTEEELLQKLKQLLVQRQGVYGAIRWQVETENKKEVQVIQEILQQLPLETSALQVNLGARSYPLYFQAQAKDQLPALITRHCPSEKLVLVTNTTLEKLHGRAWLAPLKKNFQVEKVILPDGERYKTLRTLEKIYAALVKAKADRRTPLIALGGGVIGDMAGYAAATYLRGIPFVQVPTTLLAQVDSSIGGKTGVDLPQGKNLVGAFYQPKFVLLDESFLKTLSARQLRCGLAEVIKYGAIFDSLLFRQLEKEVSDLLSGKASWQSIIRRCCELKAWVVEEDEFETKGLRAQLNFGHTLGHAIESLTHYRQYTHGEAIAMGMVFASELSVRQAHLDPKALTRVKALLEQAELPLAWPQKGPVFSKARYAAALVQDKKRVSNQLNFVYLKEVGKAFVKPTGLKDIVKWL